MLTRYGFAPFFRFVGLGIVPELDGLLLPCIPADPVVVPPPPAAPVDELEIVLDADGDVKLPPAAPPSCC